MIKLEDLTPEIYYKQSRDFQLLGRLYDVVINSVKTNADLINQVPGNAQELSASFATILATTLGFDTKHQYPTKQMAAICSVFSQIMREKGTLSAVQTAGAAILRSEGITDQFVCNKNGSVLEVFIPEDLSDITLFTDLLNYILPAGMTCTVVRANLATIQALDEILLDTSNSTSVNIITHDISAVGASTLIDPDDLQKILDVRNTFKGKLDKDNTDLENSQISRAQLSWNMWDTEADLSSDISVPGLLPNASIADNPFQKTQAPTYRNLCSIIDFGLGFSSDTTNLIDGFVGAGVFNLSELYSFFGSYSASLLSDNKSSDESNTHHYYRLDSGNVAVNTVIPLPSGSVSKESKQGGSQSPADLLNWIFNSAAYHSGKKSETDYTNYLPQTYLRIYDSSTGSETYIFYPTNKKEPQDGETGSTENATQFVAKPYKYTKVISSFSSVPDKTEIEKLAYAEVTKTDGCALEDYCDLSLRFKISLAEDLTPLGYIIYPITKEPGFENLPSSTDFNKLEEDALGIDAAKEKIKESYSYLDKDKGYEIWNNAEGPEALVPNGAFVRVQFYDMLVEHTGIKTCKQITVPAVVGVKTQTDFNIDIKYNENIDDIKKIALDQLWNITADKNKS